MSPESERMDGNLANLYGVRKPYGCSSRQWGPLRVPHFVV